MHLGTTSLTSHTLSQTVPRYIAMSSLETGRRYSTKGILVYGKTVDYKNNLKFAHAWNRLAMKQIGIYFISSDTCLQYFYCKRLPKIFGVRTYSFSIHNLVLSYQNMFT